MYADRMYRSPTMLGSKAMLEKVRTAGIGVEQQVLGRVKDSLRVMIEWRAPAVSLARKRSSVRDALRSFCRRLEQLMNFEEEGGYLADVADTRPNWHIRLCQLRDEHENLRQRIEHLTPQINDSLSWEGSRFDSACIEICELLDQVERHDRNEIALLQETILTEEGGEG